MESFEIGGNLADFSFLDMVDPPPGVGGVPIIPGSAWVPGSLGSDLGSQLGCMRWLVVLLAALPLEWVQGVQGSSQLQLCLWLGPGGYDPGHSRLSEL